jgi:hypothetical protein
MPGVEKWMQNSPFIRGVFPGRRYGRIVERCTQTDLRSFNKNRIMRRVLFMSILALTIFSCGNSGSDSERSDTTMNTTTTTNTGTGMGTGAGAGTGTGTGLTTDTSMGTTTSMDTGTGADTGRSNQ